MGQLLGQLRIIFDCCCVVLLSENCFINGKTYIIGQHREMLMQLFNVQLANDDTV